MRSRRPVGPPFQNRPMGVSETWLDTLTLGLSPRQSIQLFSYDDNCERFITFCRTFGTFPSRAGNYLWVRGYFALRLLLGVGKELKGADTKKTKERAA